MTREAEGVWADRSTVETISNQTLSCGTGDTLVLVSANLDLVRSIYAAWERGDYSSTDWAHPEIELVFADGPAPGSWTGLAGMAEAWRDFLSAWVDFRQGADEYLEVDAERVLVLARFSGRGRESGLELGQMYGKGASRDGKGASLFHLRAGKVTRHVAYADRERALAELGLPPEASVPGS